jgi:hypothetical protein
MLTTLPDRITSPFTESEIHLLCEGGNKEILNEYFCRIDTDCDRQPQFSSVFYKLKGTRRLCFQLTLVEASWVKLSVNRKDLGNLFYKQLKFTDPSVDQIVVYLMADCPSSKTDPVTNIRRVKVWRRRLNVWD